MTAEVRVRVDHGTTSGIVDTVRQGLKYGIYVSSCIQVLYSSTCACTPERREPPPKLSPHHPPIHHPLHITLRTYKAIFLSDNQAHHRPARVLTYLLRVINADIKKKIVGEMKSGDSFTVVNKTITKVQVRDI